MQDMVDGVRQHLIEVNTKYKDHANEKIGLKNFQEGELVMAHLNKGRTPTGTYSKL